MKTTLINFFLQGWPEVAALIFTASSILGFKIPTRKILLYAFGLSLVIWLVRILVVPGLHTLAALLGLVLIVYRQGKVTLGTSFYISITTIFILVCAETFIHFIYEKLFGNISIEDAFLWVIVGWPQIIILIGIAFIIQKFIRPTILNKVQ